jgi:hypothetical protein
MALMQWQCFMTYYGNTVPTVHKVYFSCKSCDDRLKGRKPDVFFNFFQFPCFWISIRIRIQDSQMNADPCGSGSTTLEGGTKNRGRHSWTALILHRQDPQNFILPTIPFSLHHNLFTVPSTLSACLSYFYCLYYLRSQMSFLPQLP